MFSIPSTILFLLGEYDWSSSIHEKWKTTPYVDVMFCWLWLILGTCAIRTIFLKFETGDFEQNFGDHSESQSYQSVVKTSKWSILSLS
jgi:hypothetical protein